MCVYFLFLNYYRKSLMVGLNFELNFILIDLIFNQNRIRIIIGFSMKLIMLGKFSSKDFLFFLIYLNMNHISRNFVVNTFNVAYSYLI